MKKLLTKIVTLILSCVLFVATLSGCSLITTDVDKDMALVVATVSIDDNIKEDVYKREMVSEFNSYGYYYVNYYGYTVADTYELILENIVKDKIIVQQAIKALLGPTGLVGNTETEGGYFYQATQVDDAKKTSVERLLSGNNYKGDPLVSFTNAKDIVDNKDYANLLTIYEVTSVKYEVLMSARSLIDSLIDKEEDELPPYENGTFTARATLGEEQDEGGNEYEIKYDDKKKVISEEYRKSAEKIAKRYDFAFDASSYDNKYDLSFNLFNKFIENFETYIQSREVKTAIFKLVKQLKENGLVKETESASVKSVSDLLKLTYFNDLMKDRYQNAIVSKYKLALENQQEKLFDKETLYNEYVNLFKSQSAETDSSVTTYEEKLASLDDSSFLVYNPEAGYGYVANLLIGFNSKQTELLGAKEEEKNVTADQINAYRQELLKGLTVKDLRESWVYSGYGTYDENLKTYTFDDKSVRTDALKTFNGNIYGAKQYTFENDDGDKETGYSFDEIIATKTSFKDFYNNVMADTNLLGFNPNYVDSQGLLTIDYNNLSTIGSINADPVGSKKISDAHKEIFTDLIYAYSTDGGSLSENFGYVYSPVTSATKYVKEFADASQKVVEKGAGYYTIVATEFGYHIILCTYSLGVTGEDPMTKQQFMDELDSSEENTFAKLFKQNKLELIVKAEVETLSSSFITTNLKKVVYYKNTYKNLVNG
ncbi:MAG: hypothetical protein IJW26_00925 [Clostridia bacterium]|nr:hypothetical protein [Clostridia bacterium]